MKTIGLQIKAGVKPATPAPVQVDQPAQDEAPVKRGRRTKKD